MMKSIGSDALNNEEMDFFLTAMRRFRFNISVIERKYCNNTSGLIYSPHEDKMVFDSSLCSADSEEDHLRAISRQLAAHRSSLGDSILSAASPEADNTPARDATRMRKLNKIFDEMTQSMKCTNKSAKKPITPFTRSRKSVGDVEQSTPNLKKGMKRIRSTHRGPQMYQLKWKEPVNRITELEQNTKIVKPSTPVNSNWLQLYNY